jgi:phage terminase Nu1 subunit (DNA packaging protein)
LLIFMGSKKSFIVTRTDLAGLLACTPDRISKYIQEGMPVQVTGAGRGRPTRLDLAAVLPWILQRRTGTFDEARTRYYQAQADRVELETRRRRGALLEETDVRADYATVAHNTKARLRAIPSAIVTELIAAAPRGAATVHALLLSRIDDALRELASGSRLGTPRQQKHGGDENDIEARDAGDPSGANPGTGRRRRSEGP